jgi:hypothetical protein
MRAKLIIGVFLVALFLLSYHVINLGQREAYTVLYFSDPVRPLLYDAESKTIAFNFTIENHEYSLRDYTYRIKLLSAEGVELAFKEGEVELRHGENATLSEELMIAENPLGGKLYVELYVNTSKEPYRSIWQRIR